MQKTNLERKKIFDKIVRLIIKDPEKGLKVFYNRYGKMIYLTAIAVGCKEDQANSVVNGVLVKVWKKWLPTIMASAVIVLCAVLSPVIINALKPAPTPPGEEVYFTDDLSKEQVSFEEAFNGLSQANISHVDMSEYSFMDTSLYYTEDRKVKGAKVSFYNSTFFAEMSFYDKNVDLNLDLNVLYDSTCKINSTEVLYKFKQESSGIYEYGIYANHNNVKYVIEYKGVTDNLMDFLNEFFG